MAGLDVNGVGATQGTGASYEVKKQDDKNEFINSSFGQGYGASGGGQVDKPAFGVVNTYGGDVANFAKFKGNDKYDAMEKTNDAAGDIKKLYMQLQHEFPGIELQFEPMPNPQTVGKKREGFNIYKQQLKDWKDIAMTQINNARERNTVEVVGDAVEAVNQNTNEKAAMNAALTAGYGEANLEATEEEGAKTRNTVVKDGAKTRRAVHSEGAATRKTVRAEGAKTRDVVHIEGAITRNVVRKESADIQNTTREVGRDIQNTVHEEATTTRETVRKAGQETQEINEMSNQVSDVLNTEYHTGETKKQVGNMRDKIVSSNLPHESKKEMLNDLADFSDQVVITDHEIKDKQKDVDLRIATERDTQEPEVPEREAPPLREYPVYEDPYANTETKNPPKTMSGYNKPIRKNPFIKGDTPKVIDNAGETSSAPKTKKLPKTSGNRGPLAPEKEPSILDKPFWKK